MRKFKHYTLVLCCSMLMFVQTSYAQWPVFDFSEFVPIGKDVKTGIDTYNRLKEQLKNKDFTLNSIGKEVSSFAKFSKAVKKHAKNAKKTAEKIVKDVKENTDKSKQALEDAKKSAETTIDTQKDTASDYVNQTQDTMDGQSSQKTSYNIEPQSYMLSENTITLPIIFEEEEEEEEQTDISVLEEEINILQKTATAEQKQLFVEFNDILDSQLTILNKSAEDTENALKELSSIIEQVKKINQDKKIKLQEKIAQIAQKQRQTNDWAIRIVESMKENYNKEYNTRIKDGMNNYTKVVIAYIRGDATRESVVSAGEMLKKSINTINITPDSGVLNELYEKMANIQAEVESLADEVGNAVENT